MPLNERERDIVKMLTETKAVDFEAIGKAVAKFGPSASLDFDYEPMICGTMRFYIHLYRFPGTVVVNPEQIEGSLGE